MSPIERKSMVQEVLVVVETIGQYLVMMTIVMRGNENVVMRYDMRYEYYIIYWNV